MHSMKLPTFLIFRFLFLLRVEQVDDVVDSIVLVSVIGSLPVGLEALLSEFADRTRLADESEMADPSFNFCTPLIISSL